jgi:hypothetical protein
MTNSSSRDNKYTEKQTLFAKQVTARLESDLSRLDALSIERLYGIRQRALAVRVRQSINQPDRNVENSASKMMRLVKYLPAGLATAALLIVTLQNTVQRQSEEQPIDADLLMTQEDLDFYEDYEFYEWLATNNVDSAD